ncbi:hypothetical protein K493DRAFT_296479 [Basidiobolus meristosporus CBS 931.73]|uniref:FZ domain-containing protein n=1 Tax=Basidiobolus meristosporus CBS 931.73 TaxID=1314790 RepID=A0A1Y1Z5A8_9FUNG|nr:hypothetical protein K493DRAFT_296479 [Basidiobolus meristosporus CBS 931.73]|eukprot:ORY05430.1 hypothetical protein K493DRAFT_296479 [Basidiobolus meristosporus CBS 931.73]
MRGWMMYGAFLTLVSLKVLVLSSPITIPLVKNTIASGDIHSGETSHYYYDALDASNPILDAISAPKTYNLYISLSICSLPEHASQLKPLEISLSQSHPTSGPDGKLSDNSSLKIKQDVGLEYIRLVVENISPTKSLYVGVHAPHLAETNPKENHWQYELSISTTGFMENESGLSITFHDADHNTAAFSMPQHTKRPNVFKAYVLQEQEDLPWMPLCMLSKKSLKSFHVKRDLAQESVRFHVDDLNVNTSYRIYHVEESTGPTRYRRVTRGVSFGTAQTESNCVVIQPANFCTKVNYAVPSLSNGTNQATLAKMYDDYAHARYLEFEKALGRFDCSTVYSPLRNCTHCLDAYRTWVCAITIPRCAGGKPPGGEAPGLQYRNDNAYAVGPFFLNQTNAFMQYLPCLDVCLEVVRSCPAFFQFSCPSPDPSSLDYGTAPNCNSFTTLTTSQGAHLHIPPTVLSALLLYDIFDNSYLPPTPRDDVGSGNAPTKAPPVGANKPTDLATFSIGFY